MAPLAHAMGLVDDDAGEEAAIVELLERRRQLPARGELLGRDVQQAQARTASAARAAHLEVHFARAIERLVARELVCLDVHRLQPRHLLTTVRDIKQQKNNKNKQKKNMKKNKNDLETIEITWSRISDLRGDTTTVNPSLTRAGSW